ncbi:hypothetical protein CRUP_020804, partial [Coryphaenoides rupestris]
MLSPLLFALLAGRDTVLNCTFSGSAPFSPGDISVFWQLTDTKRSVHSYWGAQDQLEDQAPSFANRTALFPDRLTVGDVSLLLRRVRVTDEGSYTCFVRVQNYSSAALLLQVAAAYSNPAVTLPANSHHRPGDTMDLTCTAYGGYPEATVLWQDGGGRNLTDNVTNSLVANEDGLFSVHSVLSIVLNMAFPPVALWVTEAGPDDRKQIWSLETNPSPILSINTIPPPTDRPFQDAEALLSRRYSTSGTSPGDSPRAESPIKASTHITADMRSMRDEEHPPPPHPRIRIHPPPPARTHGLPSRPSP